MQISSAIASNANELVPDRQLGGSAWAAHIAANVVHQCASADPKPLCQDLTLMPRAQDLPFEQSGSGRLRQLLVAVPISQVDPQRPFRFPGSRYPKATNSSRSATRCRCLLPPISPVAHPHGWPTHETHESATDLETSSSETSRRGCLRDTGGRAARLLCTWRNSPTRASNVH